MILNFRARLERLPLQLLLAATMALVHNVYRCVCTTNGRIFQRDADFRQGGRRGRIRGGFRRNADKKVLSPDWYENASRACNWRVRRRVRTTILYHIIFSFVVFHLHLRVCVCVAVLLLTARSNAWPRKTPSNIALPAK